MSAMRTSRRIAATAIAAASLIAPIGALEASATGEDDSNVVVESTGDQTNAITLPPPAAVGERAVSATSFDLVISADDFEIALALQLDMTSEVTELTADGGYVAITTIDHVELTEAPTTVDVSALGYDGLAGAQFQQTFDASGKTMSTELLNADQLGEAARSAAEGFTGNLQSAQFVYPDEPVGVGARWTADLEIATEGFAIPTTYAYELTAITDGRYTIAVSYESEFDTTIEGQQASGDVTGLGTVVGSVDNPLDVSVTLDQTIDATSGGVDVSVVIGIGVAATVP